MRGFCRLIAGCAIAGALSLASFTPSMADDLPSWNDGPTKKSIVDFVTAVTTEGGPDYV